MKKMLISMLVLFSIFSLCSCGKKETVESDALKFKEEYESLNGKKNSKDIEYRKLSIAEDNPFVYASAKEIIEMIEDGETFYVYFGDRLCPWCRSVLENAIKVAKDKNIKKIYYVKIWDEEGQEVLRDRYKLNDNQKPELVSESEHAKEYKALLTYFDKVLNDYTLSTEDGKKISVGEKRIYAPNFIYVDNGVAIKLTEGISELQENAYQELTDEINNEELNLFEQFFNN